MKSAKFENKTNEYHFSKVRATSTDVECLSSQNRGFSAVCSNHMHFEHICCLAAASSNSLLATIEVRQILIQVKAHEM